MKFLLGRIDAELARLASCDQLRRLSPPLGRDFCSNDYFMLSKHPKIKSAVLSSVAREGYGSTSSRFIRGERSGYSVLQQRLADFKGCQKALLFSSGYAANIGVMQSLMRKGDLVFSDRLNHASIIDGIRLSKAQAVIYDHIDIDDLQHKLKASPTSSAKFIVTESLFSMDGDIALLDRLAQIAKEHDATLIVDEAHAIGLFGDKGSGLIDHFGLAKNEVITSNGLGKAFGCYGGFVAASEIIIEYITQKARMLMYTTALPPLSLAAIDAALDIVQSGDDLRRHLFHKVEIFAALLLGKNCFRSKELKTPIFPIVIKDNKKCLYVSQQMKLRGFDVKCIRPPTVPHDTARLRATVNLSLQKDDMESFVRHLGDLL